MIFFFKYEIAACALPYHPLHTNAVSEKEHILQREFRGKFTLTKNIEKHTKNEWGEKKIHMWGLGWFIGVRG